MTWVNRPTSLVDNRLMFMRKPDNGDNFIIISSSKSTRSSHSSGMY